MDPHSDGYPEAWYLPAAANIPAGYARKGRLFDDRTGTNTGNQGFVDFSYRNDQPATTLWYHDHSVGMTRVNVYAGPAGFWLIRGGVYEGAHKSSGGAAVLPGRAPIAGEGVVALNTPGDPVRNKIREIPIVIQDRSFNADGSLFYPAQRTFFDNFAGPYVPDTDIAPFWNPEAFFNTIVVNGTTWPELRVARALYRFRFLNGCDSRFLNLALKTVVAGDATGPELPFYQIGAEQGFLPKVVQIQTGFTTELPGDGTVPSPTPALNTDQALLLALAERADVIVDLTNPNVPAGIPLMWTDSTMGVTKQATLQSGVTLPVTVTENPTVGDTEEWSIYNFTADAHPIHIHLVRFQVIDRQNIPGLDPTGIPVIEAVQPWEKGFKDTVIAYPGMITKVKAKFDIAGLYVWHCHILEHEDKAIFLLPSHSRPPTKYKHLFFRLFLSPQS